MFIFKAFSMSAVIAKGLRSQDLQETITTVGPKTVVPATLVPAMTTTGAPDLDGTLTKKFKIDKNHLFRNVTLSLEGTFNDQIKENVFDEQILFVEQNGTGTEFLNIKIRKSKTYHGDIEYYPIVDSRGNYSQPQERLNLNKKKRENFCGSGFSTPFKFCKVGCCHHNCWH